jgi:hypothetical protein
MARKPQAALVARSHKRADGTYSAHVQTPRGITLWTAEPLFANAWEALAAARDYIANGHAKPAEPAPTKAERVARVMAWVGDFIARTLSRDLIANCERALRRTLPRGERVDLLCDNTRWPVDVCRAMTGAR